MAMALAMAMAMAMAMALAMAMAMARLPNLCLVKPSYSLATHNGILQSH
jgi:hypothetical protein